MALKIFKNSEFISHVGFMYAANALNGILGVLSIPFVMVSMGSESYGIYTIFLVISSYVTLILNGVSKLMIRECSNGRDIVVPMQIALGVYFYLSLFLLLLSPLFSFLVVPLIFPVPDMFQSELRWAAFLSVLESVISIPIMMCQIQTVSRQEFRKYSTFISFDGILRYALLFYGVWYFRDLKALLVCIISRRLIEIAFMKRFFCMPPKGAWIPSLSLAKAFVVLRKSVTISISYIFQLVMISIGTILINRYYGVAALGKYRAAFDLSTRIWFFSNGLGVVIFPKFSKMLSNSGERDLLLKKMRYWLELSWYSYLIIAAISIFSSEYALSLLKLSDSEIIMFFKVLMVGTCLNAHATVSYEYIIADNRYGLAAVISILSAAALYISFFLLKGEKNIFSLGWAWLVSQFLFSLISDYSVMGFCLSFNKWKNETRKTVFFAMIIVLMGTFTGSIGWLGEYSIFIFSLLMGLFFLTICFREYQAKFTGQQGHLDYMSAPPKE